MGCGGIAFKAPENRGSNPTAAISKLGPYYCLCLSAETLKSVGPSYLVSMPGKVKYPTQGNGKTCCGLTELVVSICQNTFLFTSLIIANGDLL